MTDKFVVLNKEGDIASIFTCESLEVAQQRKEAQDQRREILAPHYILALITPEQLAEYKNLRTLILDYSDDRVEESEAVVIKRLDYEAQQKEIDQLRNENASLRRKIIELCNEKK